MTKPSHRDTLTAFLDSRDDGSYYVGHATVLTRIDGKTYLIDPVFPRPLFLDSWLFFPPLALDERLFAVDGVFISHCHEDHYHLEFLRKLEPGVPIYVTEGRTGFDELFADKSLTVRRLTPSKLTRIETGLEVLSLPSGHNGFDSSFLLKGKKFSLYQGNDNFLDESVMREARSLAGPVDHAYIPYAYVWWYPFCLTSITDEQRAAEAQRLNDRNMRIGKMMADVLEARLVIPSAGNLAFFDSADSAINRGIASPFDYVEFLERIGDASGLARTRTLFAGDFALATASGSRVQQAAFGKDAYFASMDSFLKEWNSSQPKTPPRTKLEAKDLGPVQMRLQSAPKPSFDWTVILTPSPKEGVGVAYDLRTGLLGISQNSRLTDRSMIFHIQPHTFEQWLAGQVSFETILNSQRFTLERKPELFEPPVWAHLRQYL